MVRQQDLACLETVLLNSLVQSRIHALAPSFFPTDDNYGLIGRMHMGKSSGLSPNATTYKL
ncbi:hypothetical protein RRF57_009100 [Xylaria bambusicola]|uniref:Uncharacterized protein n=1 Tax=Xylaria bambusicola TaxID=326684 RepID=A0AAN7UWC5_9PEZI